MRRVIQVLAILTIASFPAISYADDGVVVVWEGPISFAPMSEDVMVYGDSRLPDDFSYKRDASLTYVLDIANDDGVVVNKAMVEVPPDGFASFHISAQVNDQGALLVVNDLEGDDNIHLSPDTRLTAKARVLLKRNGRNIQTGEWINIPAKTTTKVAVKIFGSVDSDRSTHAFVHYSAIAVEGFKTLEEGQTLN